jgi:hypothetical protein
MTNDEWESCADPRRLLDCVGHRATDRQLRLFAVACCRRIWLLLTDERCRRAVETAERFADGLAGADELESAHRTAKAAQESGCPGAPVNATASTLEPCRGRFGYDAEHPVMIDVREAASRAASQWANSRPGNGGAEWTEILRAERLAQCNLLRDIFGNLHFDAGLGPCWFPHQDVAVASLARDIYQGGDFSRLPLLADSLEQGGCDTREILDHCCGSALHVRGCWVVDLVLGNCPTSGST